MHSLNNGPYYPTIVWGYLVYCVLFVCTVTDVSAAEKR